MKRIVFLMLTLLWHAAWAAAQSQTLPRFEVVSIKQNKSGAVEGGLRINPGGQMQWANTTLKSLIGTAFQRFAFDMRETTGGPPWIEQARFDVLVQTGTGAPTVDPDGFPSETFAMIRAMLAERFGLVTHNEQRDAPIYRLVASRQGGSLGPGLRRVNADCSTAMTTQAAGKGLPWREGRGPDCTFGGPPGNLQGNAVTLDMIARVIGRQVNRHTVNATGIDGYFDLDVKFSPELVQSLPGRVPGDPLPAPTDAPSIFTAVQEQLGLRLEAARGHVDVLVVDKADADRELKQSATIH
jgi:uncharacterized protein (TIGR03435 family)